MLPLQGTPMVTPDGRVIMLNQQGQWVELRPLQPYMPAAMPAVQPQQQTLARPASQPPVSQASSISEEIAEEVLAQPLAELPTKARASCPVVEEEVTSTSDMVSEQAESESGTSTGETVDLSEEDLSLSKQVVSSTTPSTIEVQNWVVERKVQVRAGPSTGSKKVCILTPGQRVQVVKTQKSRMKTGFVTTKAYILSKEGQGWVSITRQHKKTDETFVFKGQASAGMKRLICMEKVWARHEAEVAENGIRNTNSGTFTVRVSCPTWEQMEALRKDLNPQLCRKKLINKKMPQLVNMKRVHGNGRPTVHVFNIDVDAENAHREFREAFDWSNQHQGSTNDFQHQVRDDLRELHFGARNVSWGAGRTSKGRFVMRDFCMVEFSKDAQVRRFLNNFEKYDFFQGASVKVDPTYENLTTISTESVKA